MDLETAICQWLTFQAPKLEVPTIRPYMVQYPGIPIESVIIHILQNRKSSFQGFSRLYYFLPQQIFPKPTTRPNTLTILKFGRKKTPGSAFQVRIIEKRRGNRYAIFFFPPPLDRSREISNFVILGRVARVPRS